MKTPSYLVFFTLRNFILKMWLLELITTDQYRAKELVKSGVLLGDPFLEITISPAMEVSIIGKSSDSKEKHFFCVENSR